MTGNDKKALLADPVSYYLTRENNPDPSVTAALREYSEQHRQLKAENKTLQDKKKILSGEIGRAKRSHLPLDSLIDDMQALSRRSKQIKGELAAVEKQLIGRLTERLSHTAARPFPQTRHHGSEKKPLKEVEIGIYQGSPEAWDQFVVDNPDTSIYHLSAWKELTRKVFGHDMTLFAAREKDGNLVGILPVTRISSRLFGDYLVSVPWFNYGGAVAEQADIEIKLMAAVNDYAREAGVSHVEYRDNLPRSGYAVKTDKVNMILALPDNGEALWQGFSSKLRAQIKRPQRENPRTVIGGLELLDDFYRVFSRNMRDLGTPVYTKAFFAEILRCFPSQSRLIVVYLSKRPVAAAFLLGFKERLEIPWASTISDVNHLSINMLLYWEVLQFAIRTGYRFFDFGRSSKDAGTYRFKKQWGAEPMALYWHYWLKPGQQLPSLNPSNPKYALMINIWKRLPLPLTRLIGPHIVKNLP